MEHGDDPLELNGRVVPAVDLDRSLQAMSAMFTASSSGRPSIFHVAHVLWRHRETQLLSGPLPAVQRIVLPVVVFIGRILGKFRGSNWTGSPEPCRVHRWWTLPRLKESASRTRSFSD